MRLFRHISNKGFTIVEMVVVIAVIGIVAGITIVGWNTWQTSAAKKQVESDANQLASAMESAKNFNNGYPTSLPSNFKPSSDTTVTYIAGSTNAYCVQAQSIKYPSVLYHVDSQDKKALTGACGSNFTLSAPSPTLSSVSSSAMTVTWSAVSGATSYSVKYGTTTPNVVASCSSSPCSLSGLSPTTNYTVNVTAINAITSATSSAVNATTSAAIAAPANMAVSYTTTRINSSQSRRDVTGSASCASGSVQYKFIQSNTDPDFNSVSWQAGNTASFFVITNGFIPPTDYVVYMKARCINGAEATEAPYISSNSV